tara:strand:+ start:1984 stop:2397 length:414 start_codon:yes stop_codon:yes gene_type:complete
MNRISNTLGAVAGSVLLVMAGTAMADAPQLVQNSQQPGMEKGPDRMKAPMPAMKSPDLSSIRPGTNVISSSGGKVGEVTAIDGDLVIVSVGGLLGIGARDVALQKSQYEIIGSGQKAQLRTTLTKSDLEKMPEYEKM